MAASLFPNPPSNFEALESPAYRKWFAEVTRKLNGTFKVPNPYPDQIVIDGDYNGIGQLAVTQTQATGPNLWAGYFQSIATSANVNETVVGIGCQGYHYTGGAGANVWGIATEAWTGAAAIEPTASATLQNEVSVISQYHANNAALVGLNVVFKDRKDGAVNVLHGTAGSNFFNQYSVGIQIDSQARSSSGEYCGWHTGIIFGPNSIDASNTSALDQAGGIGIDFRAAPTSRMRAAVALAPDQLVTFDGTVGLGLKYKSSTSRFGLYSSGTAIFEITNDGNGMLCVLPYTDTTASAGLIVPPATCSGFLLVEVGGTIKRFPFYD